MQTQKIQHNIHYFSLQMLKTDLLEYIGAMLCCPNKAVGPKLPIVKINNNKKKKQIVINKILFGVDRSGYKYICR